MPSDELTVQTTDYKAPRLRRVATTKVVGWLELRYAPQRPTCTETQGCGRYDGVIPLNSYAVTR